MKATKRSVKISLKTWFAFGITVLLTLSGLGGYFVIKRQSRGNNGITQNSGAVNWSVDAWDGTGSEDGLEINYGNRGADSITICSANGFAYFVESVNAGNTYAGKTVYLNKNLDLGGRKLESIKFFEGTFDGGYYTIANFSVKNGLFEKTTNATIKNLGLYNVNVTGDEYAGALIAEAIDTNISNVYVKGGAVDAVISCGLVGRCELTQNKEISSSFAIIDLKGIKQAGIVGTLEKHGTSLLTIKNCYHNSTCSVLNGYSSAIETNVGNVGNIDFSNWDYSRRLSTKAWCDFGGSESTLDYTFDYPIQAGFEKVIETGCYYEATVNGENASSLPSAIGSVLSTDGDTEIIVLVEKLILDAEVTITRAVKIDLSSAVDTTIIRGDNNNGSLFVANTDSKFTIGLNNADATITLDGQREAVEKNSRKSNALICINNANVFAIYNKVLLNNNVNNINNNGGAISVNADINVNLDNIKISNCKATNGGAIYAKTLNLGNIEITKCEAQNGGAIYADDIEINGEIGAVNLNGNKASNGGAIYAKNLVSSGVGNTNALNIENNKATYGGAIYCTENVELQKNTTIKNNGATKNGNAMVVLGALDVYGGTIENNTNLENGDAVHGEVVASKVSLKYQTNSFFKSANANTYNLVIAKLENGNLTEGESVEFTVNGFMSGNEAKYFEQNNTYGNIYLTANAKVIMNNMLRIQVQDITLGEMTIMHATSEVGKTFAESESNKATSLETRRFMKLLTNVTIKSNSSSNGLSFVWNNTNQSGALVWSNGEHKVTFYTHETLENSLFKKQTTVVTTTNCNLRFDACGIDKSSTLASQYKNNTGNYVFIGWSTEADNTAEWTDENETLTVFEDTNLYAVWGKVLNLNVVCYLNGTTEYAKTIATTTATCSYRYDDTLGSELTVALPNEADVNGYKLLGVSSNKDRNVDVELGTEYTRRLTNAVETIKVYGVMGRVINFYDGTTKLETINETLSCTETKYALTNGVLTAKAEKYDHVMPAGAVGYSRSANATAEYTTVEAKADGNHAEIETNDAELNLYAVKQKTIQIYIKTANGTMLADTIDVNLAYNETDKNIQVKLDKTLTRDGYTFEGWTTAREIETNANLTHTISTSKVVNGKITYYPVWSKTFTLYPYVYAFDINNRTLTLTKSTTPVENKAYCVDEETITSTTFDMTGYEKGQLTAVNSFCGTDYSLIGWCKDKNGFDWITNKFSYTDGDTLEIYPIYSRTLTLEKVGHENSTFATEQKFGAPGDYTIYVDCETGSISKYYYVYDYVDANNKSMTNYDKSMIVAHFTACDAKVKAYQQYDWNLNYVMGNADGTYDANNMRATGVTKFARNADDVKVTIELGTAPTIAGRTFLGWTLHKDTNSIDIAKDATTYTHVFATSNDTLVYYPVYTLPMPTSATKQSSTTATALACTKASTTANSLSTANTTASTLQSTNSSSVKSKAQAMTSYTVTLYLDSSSIGSVSVDSGTTIASLYSTASSTYSSLLYTNTSGFFYDSACTQHAYDTDTITSAISLYARSASSSLFKFTSVTGGYSVKMKSSASGDVGDIPRMYNGSSVVAIESNAFSLASSVRCITIPATVTSIGSMAFAYCSGFTTIGIPKGVTSIEYGAFMSCTTLTSISIPDGITSIGYYVFENSGLTSITIPSSVTSIGEGVFNSCYNLTSITVASGNTVYDSRNNCNAIIKTSTNELIAGCKNTTIPATVTSIGNEAFQSCTGLTSITIPNSVTSIGSYAFYYCKGLTSITIPASVTSIGSYAFQNCSKLTSITFENTTGWFYTSDSSATSGTSMDVSNPSTNVTNLVSNYSGYYWTTNDTSVNLYLDGSSVGSVTVTSGKTIASLYSTASAKYSSLLYTNTCGFFYDSNCTQYAYDTDTITADITLYTKTATTSSLTFTSVSGGYSVKKNGTPSGVVVIPRMYSGSNVTQIYSASSYSNGAFKSCSSITAIIMPCTITSIGNYAFYWCYGLASITLPAGVTSIGNWAFNYCSAFTGPFIIPDSVTSVGNNAFSYCSKLTGVTIGSGVTSIGDNAFYECSSLASIAVVSGNTVYDSRNSCNAIIQTSTNTLIQGSNNAVIPSGVTSIAREAFRSCKGLTSITIPNSVTSVGVLAFLSCTGLTNVTIGSGVTSIGSSVFSGCSALTSIIIPSNVTSIEDSAFYSCSGLTSLTIPASVTSIGNYAFNGCSGLTSIAVASGNTVYDSRNSCNAIIETSTNTLIQGCKNTTIPSTVTSIGASAFAYCSSLTTITIPNSVTSIEYGAFYYCTGLTSITIPDGVTIIGDSAFSNCTGLTGVTIGSGVTSIGDRAFISCSALTSITIPDSVTSIKQYAFAYCSKLTSITFENTVGWYYTSDSSATSGTSIAVSNASTNATNLKSTYYNKYWKTNVIKVTFNANGGTCSTASKTVVYTSTYGDLPTPAYTGYDFDGWFTEATGGTQITSSTTVTITSAQTLYAHWTLQLTIVTDTSYMYYNCSALTSLSFGLSFDTSNVTTMNYMFSGCSGLKTLDISNFVISSGCTVVNMLTGCTALETFKAPKSIASGITITLPKMMITSDGIVYNSITSAQAGKTFSTNFSTLTFDANNGVCDTDVLYFPLDDEIDALPTATRTGYTFTGWFTTANGGTEYTVGKVMSTKETTTLYANWTANTFTIAFDKNHDDATGTTASVTATYDSVCTLTTNGFTRTNYKLTGWATSASGTKVYDNSATLTASKVNSYYATAGNGGTITLYAVWEICMIDLTATGYSGTYDKSAHSITVTINDLSGAVVTYSTEENGTYTSTNPTFTNAETYTVYYKAEATGYQTSTGSAVVTISPYSLVGNATIADVDAQTYTGEEIKPTPAVTALDETLICGTDYSYAYTNNINAGTATVKIVGTGNYTGTLTKSFTISKATLTVTAENKSMTYGGSTPTYTYSITGFVNGETISTVTGSVTYTIKNGNDVISNVSTANAGTYSIVPSGLDSTNYSISYVNGTLTINNADLTGAVEISGTIKFGETLTANTTNALSASVSYQWYYSANCMADKTASEVKSMGTAINGATSSTYTVGSEATGKYIAVIATLTKTNYNTLSVADGTYIVAEKAKGSISLANAVVENIYTADITNTISEHHGGTLSVTSSDETVATASISGSTITLAHQGKMGNITITVTSAESADYKQSTATFIAKFYGYLNVVKNGTTSSDCYVTKVGAYDVHLTGENNKFYADEEYNIYATTSAVTTKDNISTYEMVNVTAYSANVAEYNLHTYKIVSPNKLELINQSPITETTTITFNYSTGTQVSVIETGLPNTSVSIQNNVINLENGNKDYVVEMTDTELTDPEELENSKMKLSVEMDADDKNDYIFLGFVYQVGTSATPVSVQYNSNNDNLIKFTGVDGDSYNYTLTNSGTVAEIQTVIKHKITMAVDSVEALSSGNVSQFNLTCEYFTLNFTTDSLIENGITLYNGEWTISGTSNVDAVRNFLSAMAGSNTNKNTVGYKVSDATDSFYLVSKTAKISYTTTDVTKKLDSATFTNPINNTGDGTVIYTSSNTSVATVDSSTGEVTIVGVGDTTITAVIDTDDNPPVISEYVGENATASYALTIGKKAGYLAFSVKSVSGSYGSENFTHTASKTGDGTITYSSSNTDVAEVNSTTGEVTIKAPGDATITATIADGATYTYQQTTASYTISIKPLAGSISYSANSVVKTYGDGASKNTLTIVGDGTITYSSSNTSVASVDNSGNVTITGAGTAIITATVADGTNYAYADNTASYTITVKKASATISYATATETSSYGANKFTKALTNSGNGTVTYSSSNTSVATVDNNGEITVVGVGTTEITATVADSSLYTYATKTASYTLTVNKAEASISFNSNAVEKLLSDANFTNAITNTGDGTVTYSSSNTSVASVNSATGEVDLLAVGTTTITATVVDGTSFTYPTKTATYTITVA